MVNHSGLGKTKMPLFKSHEHAIEAGHRPMFGTGHDLHIIVAIIFIGTRQSGAFEADLELNKSFM